MKIKIKSGTFLQEEQKYLRRGQPGQARALALILYPHSFYINYCITANLRTDSIYRVQFIARPSPTSCHPEAGQAPGPIHPTSPRLAPTAARQHLRVPLRHLKCWGISVGQHGRTRNGIIPRWRNTGGATSPVPLRHLKRWRDTGRGKARGGIREGAWRLPS